MLHRSRALRSCIDTVRQTVMQATRRRAHAALGEPLAHYDPSIGAPQHNSAAYSNTSKAKSHHFTLVRTVYDLT